jgi:hypothetical protein
MMSKLSIASWGLFVGAIGQGVFYSCVFPHYSVRISVPAALLPWLTVFIISFCKQAPFGPRLFRYCLVFAMCWYGITALLAEILHLFIHGASAAQSSITVARILMYLGALSFIVFIQACFDLRAYEGKAERSQGVGNDRLPT